MRSISLNGIWRYRIGKGTACDIEVPFSALPVGHFECTRTFDAEVDNQYVFLKFDGITYQGRVFLNGTFLGQMGPYCEYSFDVTGLIKGKDNELRVEMEDISPAFGPSEGWENFGGIIRDVQLLYLQENFIEDVFFHSNLMNGYRDAEFTVETKTHHTDGNICVQLAYKGVSVAESECLASQSKITGILHNIKLWSPDTPELYELRVSLQVNGQTVDNYTCNVGFREFKCDKHRFLLNGKPLFLKGVCKHEMVKDSGHCPTDAQVENDMRIIKKMGCNFVRLVHYPHNKKVLDIADRLGLMVSEEPGLWWSDTQIPEVSSGSLEVLRRTILRDRNHPSIVFWLCFNECKFTEQYLIDSANVCRQYDPTRLVSGANCMSNEETLLYYNKCGFDFYTMHPYSQTFDMAKESSQILNDKPLLFTEWGGYYLYDNPHLMQEFLIEMHSLYLQGSLAGAFFWFFAELNDFNRGRPACIDGVLREGLVTKDRVPTLIYDAFCQGLKLFDGLENTQTAFWYEAGTAFEPLSSQNMLSSTTQPSNEVLRTVLQELTANYGCMRKRELTSGPVLPWQTPYVLKTGMPLVFSGGAGAKKLSVLGLTSIVNGYPLGGDYGQPVCKIVLEYDDDSIQEMLLKNGIHITSAFALHRSSRINPVAEKAQRFALFGYDKNFEIYVMNRLDISLESGKKLQRAIFIAENDQYATLLYGVFAD